MDRLGQRLELARQASQALGDALSRTDRDDLARDGLIFRFTVAAEAIWKLAQSYLADRELSAEGSPKGCARASLEAGLVDAAQCEALLRALADRNVAIHAYSDETAVILVDRVAAHHQALQAWLRAIEARA